MHPKVLVHSNHDRILVPGQPTFLVALISLPQYLQFLLQKRNLVCFQIYLNHHVHYNKERFYPKDYERNVSKAEYKMSYSVTAGSLATSFASTSVTSDLASSLGINCSRYCMSSCPITLIIYSGYACKKYLK